jgi:hypothetical protein
MNLADVIDRILDKGLIINADITISVVGVELLGIKIRAAVASFETAAMYGLEFPSGTRLPEWAGGEGSPSGASLKDKLAAPSLARNGAAHQSIPLPYR